MADARLMEQRVSNEKYLLPGGLDMRVLRTVVALTAAVVAADITTVSAQDLSGCGNHSVAIVVDPVLVASVRIALNQFENDLCSSGYNTVEHSSGFANPPSLRAYLGGLYGQQGRNLAGAILIGDIPHAYQWVTLHSSNPSIPSTSEEVISFQYYADLNGTFAKSAAYTSPGGHEYSYDLHSGDVGWEIWIGVLPRYKGNLQQTTAAIIRYFAKNHAYRSRQLRRPSVFLEINEHFHATTLTEHDELMALMRSGPYSWTPYSNAAGARLYFDSPPGGLSVQQGYTDMQNGVADFTVTDTHGYWGASGQLTIATVETMPVKTLFFWSNGCAVGDLDHTDNFLASVLYSPTSDVLVAKGTTNDSGGMGNNSNGFFGHNIASALASGAVFGDAVRSHVNVPLIWPWSISREFHFGTVVILGDPTLRRSGPGFTFYSDVDFDGDGRNDIGVYRDGMWFIIRSLDGGGTTTGWGGLPQDIPVPGDYDGDGRTDVAYYRDGTWFILRSSNGGVMATGWGGLPQDIPVPGDYDGDGKTDMAVYRDGTWFILRSFDGGVTATEWGGLPQDVPVPADYDGDGRTDVAVYRDGIWFILLSSGGVIATGWGGLSQDTPVSADYDGDGKADIAVYRDGAWFILRSSDGGVTSTGWGGLPQDVLVPADYDGDRKTDISVYRNGTWFILRSSDGGVTTTGWGGLPQDIPLNRRSD
jgi:hypothetical protein